MSNEVNDATRLSNDGQRHHSIFVRFLFTYISRLECESSIMGSHNAYTRALKLAWKNIHEVYTQLREYNALRLQIRRHMDVIAH